MTYSLEFDARALKEWHKLGSTVREQLKLKLIAILDNPRVEGTDCMCFRITAELSCVAAAARVEKKHSYLRLLMIKIRPCGLILKLS